MKKIDENFFKNNTGGSGEIKTIDEIVGDDEQILWRGKPKKSAFILGNALSMLPIVLVWLLFDGFFIGLLISEGGEIPKDMIIFMCIFFAFHLMPVWIWVSKIVTANKRHKNLEYAFTNKRIIIKSGIVAIDFQNLYYSDIDSVNVKVGLIDKILKVGDIYVKTGSQSQVINDVENPYFLTKRLQEIVLDMKADLNFPNDLRPQTNGGYNVKSTKNYSFNQDENEDKKEDLINNKIDEN